MKSNFIKKAQLLFFIALACNNLLAQNDTLKYELNTLGVISTGLFSPFWLQNNQYGAISEQPFSFNAGVVLSKEMSHPHRLFDYSFKVSALFKTDPQKSEVLMHEYYAKARLSVFGLSIGARKEHYGNQDSTLSSGGFLFSQNSRPMPKIWAGIENFVPVPFTANFLEIKGGISHGVFIDDIFETNVLLHHKYMYLRLGGKLPVKVQYGMDHVAQWGGFSRNYGLQPSSISDFKKVFFAQSGGSNASQMDQINVLGNHIISQSMKVEVQVSDFQFNTYWQNMSEDSPIRLMWQSMNVFDGVWGISVKNNKLPYIKGILYEFINTTDQSGPFHDKDGVVYGGSDNYMNNLIYLSGWSYFYRTIGNPLISSPIYNTDGTIYSLNNRIKAHHCGFEGNYAKINFRFLATLSKNFGLYPLSDTNVKHNNSFLLEGSGEVIKNTGIEAKVSVGADFGNLHGNSMGFLIGIRKSGSLFKY